MSAWETIDAFLTDLGVPIGAPTTGQTTGGSHVAGSEHYQGRARDYGAANSDASAIVNALLPLAQGPNAPVDELFYSPMGVFYDKGVAITPTGELRAEHYDHVHVGIAPGVDLTQFVASAGTGARLVSASGGLLSSLNPFSGAVSSAKRIIATGVFLVGGLALVVMGGIRNVRPREA